MSIDFYNNDMTNMGDNCMEADGGAHNIRVFRNRCVNTAAGALGAQPIIGGPAYFYQNVVYNAPTGGAMRFVDTPSGVLVFQNTFIGQGPLMGPASNVHFLNNLIIGDGWAEPVLNLRTYHELLDFGLQRFPPESKRRGCVRVEFAPVWGGCRL